MTKLWGGRFAAQTDALVHRYNASIGFDIRLYDEDITGSVAWARGLADAGLLTAEERDTLLLGLEAVRAEFAAGTFVVAPDDEDIHSAVERRLTELAGPVGGKLHTGRSRNDQVATDFRLWVMRACGGLAEAVAEERAAGRMRSVGMTELARLASGSTPDAATAHSVAPALGKG